MNSVIRWLESTEGDEWSRRTFSPGSAVARYGSRTGSPPVIPGPLDPAEDPCGRGPLPVSTR
jgi:hypothetical protein